MNISTLTDFGASLGDKIPADLKTMSVVRRHNVFISHALPAHRVLDIVPTMPPELQLDTLPISGESCAFLQTVLRFNDDLHYTPLALPNLSFWQLEFGVLVRRTMQGATRQSGFFALESFCATRAAWVLGRALAGAAHFADFNVILRGSEDDAYATFIADMKPENPALATQIAVRQTNEIAVRAPFVNAEKRNRFFTERPTSLGALSVAQKFGAVQNVVTGSSEVLNAEIAPVGGEIGELRLGFWETLGILKPDELRAPFAMSLVAEIKTVLQSPTFL